MKTYCEKFFEKQFSNEDSKKAYLDACKWLAVNVYGKKFSKDVSVRVTKLPITKKSKIPTFNVELFATINGDEMEENHCHKCKQLHTIFYCIDYPDCKKCNFKKFKKELEDRIFGLREYFGGQIND